MLWAVCKRAYIRLCSLPADHILHKTVTEAYSDKDRPLSHPTPIEKLARLFNINPSTTEKIPALKAVSNLSNFVDTLSFPTREDSIEHERQDDTGTRVYTDGSGQDGYVGAAASLYLDNDHQPVATRHLHLGTMDQHSTYEAELVGILLAFWLLITEAGHILGRQPISIYTDNQSVISALTSGSRGPAEYIKDEIARLCDKYFPRHLTHRVTVKWISAHSEVPRNEKIDFEAKQASLGISSDRQHLPRLLRAPLPTSISALRQILKRETGVKSEEIWRQSPRWERFANFEDNYSFRNFHDIADSIDRHKATLLVKIRTDHFPLNAYLHKRKIIPSNACTSCNEGSRESLRHYLWECPKFASQRTKLREVTSGSGDSLELILKNRAHTEALLDYVVNTKRFARNTQTATPLQRARIRED
ncbi:hypothetical protein CVT24_009556 [Panaeolus cyanescens]|uniref:RNase H type-1 domain-containing protein n=1 Tax=Panaeolus cyanescens TaxID=181874 RepID=A0A409YAD9_9AGAR|nr:hypothetical protein CVT24_009556 [Panaeolus cyanescens]